MTSGEVSGRTIILERPQHELDGVTDQVTAPAITGQKSATLMAPAVIQGVRTMADGTIRATIDMAKELPAEEMTRLFELKNTGLGWFAFKANEIELRDLPDKKAVASIEKKSPSERMYAVFFLRWLHLTDQKTPFELWYVNQMGILINNLKRGLPAREQEKEQ